jgi:hypothetical protein
MNTNSQSSCRAKKGSKIGKSTYYDEIIEIADEISDILGVRILED